MARFIHSILEPDQAISADGDQTYDLPVNPLSAILLNISPLNDTGTITAYQFVEGLLSAVDNIRVDYKGSAIFNMAGVDAAAMALLYHGFQLWQSNAVETNDNRRSLVLPICFGRMPYMQSECFPESKKGELTMQVEWDIADTGFDGLRMSIETIELPEATPTHFEKKTTLSQTFAATGQNDIDLPIGNVLRACLLWGTTGAAGASFAPTIAEWEFLIDNIQRYYSGTTWEVSRGILGLMKRPFPVDAMHIHSVDASGAGEEDTRDPQVEGAIDDNYALALFDVTQDDEFSVDTNGAGRVNIRVEAEAAEAVRALPVERFAVSDLDT